LIDKVKALGDETETRRENALAERERVILKRIENVRDTRISD
jgi:hypothetical protein